MSCIPELAIQSCDTGQRIPFWQLSIAHNIDFLVAKYKSVPFYTAAKMKGWTYVHTDVCKHSKRTDSKLLLLEISKSRNCSSVGCLKCEQFHSFSSIKKKGAYQVAA